MSWTSQWPSGLLKFVKKTVWLFSREGGGGVWFVKENVVRIVIFICIVVQLGANQCYRYHLIVMFEDGQHHQASFSSTVPKLPITNTAFI